MDNLDKTHVERMDTTDVTPLYLASLVLGRKKDDGTPEFEGSDLDRTRQVLDPATKFREGEDIKRDVLTLLVGLRDPDFLKKVWLHELKSRFNAVNRDLHKSTEWRAPTLREMADDSERSTMEETTIEWEDVAAVLENDPKLVKVLMDFDAKGHKINVLGGNDGSFSFVSAFSDQKQISADHNNLCFDQDGEDYAKRYGRKDVAPPKGNVLSIIAEIMGVSEQEAGKYLADKDDHTKLINADIIKNCSTWANEYHLEGDEDIINTPCVFSNDRITKSPPTSMYTGNSFRVKISGFRKF